MALTTEELAFIRESVSEPNDAGGWTEARFNTVATGATHPDGSYNLRLLSALVWEAKAASLVTAVNVSESGSSRDASQAFDHAMAMAKRFGADAVVPAESPESRPRSTRMVRPTRG